MHLLSVICGIPMHIVFRLKGHLLARLSGYGIPSVGSLVVYLELTHHCIHISTKSEITSIGFPSHCSHAAGASVGISHDSGDVGRN